MRKFLLLVAIVGTAVALWTEDASACRRRSRRCYCPCGAVHAATIHMEGPLFGNCNCSAASGSFAPPTTSISQCYLENVNTGQKYNATTITYPAPGQWQATFPVVPPGTYKAIAVGNDGTKTPCGPFNCPAPKAKGR